MALSWTDDAHKERMVRGWRGGLADGTPCGSGSTLANAKSVAARLPEFVGRYGILSVCDAGAGDLHWIKAVAWQVRYRAFDLYPRVAGVAALDITKEPMPPCDAILCRHVLIHLDPPRIERTLELFRQSGRYLLASQYDNCHAFDTVSRRVRTFDPQYDYNPTDLRPLLGEPLERIPDTGSDLALWRLA